MISHSRKLRFNEFIMALTLVLGLQVSMAQSPDSTLTNNTAQTQLSNDPDTLNYTNILGRYVSEDPNITDTIEFSETSPPSGVIMSRSANTSGIKGVLDERYFFRVTSPQVITRIGSYSPWYIQIARVTIVGTDILEIAYSGSYDFPENGTIVMRYRKIGK